MQTGIKMIQTDAGRKISERLWNLPDKGELESLRETTFIDDIIQKSHIEKELLANLDGIETVFDGGAGCGRFSILLAKTGCKVTHFDISRPMLDKARELARKAGVEENISFVEGALEDLSQYRNQSFDLVMSFDAPISYTYPNQERVIGELIRIAKKKVMFSVSSRLGCLPYLSNPIQKNQFILDSQCSDPWVQWCIANRQNAIDSFTFDKAAVREFMKTGLSGYEDKIAEYEGGGVPWCITYTFLPDELKALLEKFGVKNIEMAGPGAYARTIPNEILVKIMNNEKDKSDFLEICHEYDSNPYVCGMGKDNLFVKGDIAPEVFSAYHVVTEKPMHLGQRITFDEEHHSGVYQRVMEKLPLTEDIYKNPEKYENAELEYPVIVALRELALEEVRQKSYPDYPSRMSCLYVSETLQEAVQWADYFLSLGRPTFQIVKVRITGKRFMGDAAKCFHATVSKEENLRLARRYWENVENPGDETPINEFLVSGDIEVLEILREFQNN